MKRKQGEPPNQLDWLVYRLFRWWWNPIFMANPGMALSVEREFAAWRLRNFKPMDHKDI